MSEGKKNDQGKPEWAYATWGAFEEVVKVIDFGAAKYGRNNWRDLANPRIRYFSAAIRHLTAYATGEQYDKESGLPHLAHAMCSLAFMLEIDKNEKLQKPTE